VRVFRAEVAGGAAKPVLTAGGSYGDVQITPDGQTLVFTRASLTGPAEIYKAHADGTGITPVTQINSTFLNTFALKAGESITFDGAGGTKVQAWIVKPNTFKEGTKYPLLYWCTAALRRLE
jgi:dipeptidyl aminopeptidase/acylaminoacyl peptidase